MIFVFDIDKTVAAASYLAKKKGGAISIFLLLKMMYAAERRALLEWHRPITGDSFCSLKKGIILSRTYNLIKREVMGTNSDMTKWATFFSPRSGNEIRLLAEPDYDFLSQREIEALDAAAHEIENLVAEHGLIADVLHAKWPEWKDPEKLGKRMIPVDLHEVIAETVDDDDEVQRICNEIHAVHGAKAALQVSA